MMQYNKGEWSELYTLFTIFNDRKIAAADSNLEPTSEYYDFLEVLREDEPGKMRFYNLERKNSVVILNENRQKIKELNTGELSEKTKKILNVIKDKEGGGTFVIPEAIALMEEYCLEKVKAKSSDKSDIQAIVRDKISSRQKLGFSIKSRLGGAPTLLNASAHTGFKFKVKNIQDIQSINDVDGVKGKVKAIYEQGGLIEYQCTTSQIFKDNLRLIDTVLPSILASMIIKYFSGESNNVSGLCKAVATDNIYELTEKDIEFKIKNLLRAIALGMVPGKPWSTRLSTYGGYIVVKETGDLVCYHLYNDDDFKDYLFTNTKFDTPDAKRHDFGYLYTNGDGAVSLDLNFQIRFIK